MNRRFQITLAPRLRDSEGNRALPLMTRAKQWLIGIAIVILVLAMLVAALILGSMLASIVVVVVGVTLLAGILRATLARRP